MSEQTTMTGPARLRQIAEFTSILSANELHQLAGTWDADLERAARDHDLAMSIMAERLTRAERAEAALERARALLRRIEWQDATTRPIFCDIVVCVACGRDHPNHKPDCELAALLAPAAQGGAA